MAVDSARSLQYEYKATSNLVLQADRSLIDRRGRDEATGEVQTLVGKIGGIRMGDRYERTRPPVKDADMPKRKKSRHMSDQGDEHSVISKGSSLLSTEMEELSGVYYRPRTRETKSTYEILLSFIQKMIGDQPRDVLCGAADEVLATLKADHLKEKEKKKEISSLLGPLEEDQFAMLSGLGRRITDYGADKHAAVEADAIDENYGVAVVFHEEEGDEGAKTENVVAQEEDPAEDDDEGIEAEFEGVIHGVIDSDKAGAEERAKEKLEPRSVDAYWLQRELNKFFKDPIVSLKKADEVLEILQGAGDIRDCENKLVLLLGYDQFQFIKVLHTHTCTFTY
jgi:pre-mRNA-splicing helicase BRR2